MSKVYIINNCLHDYSSAAKFGEASLVTEGKVPIFKTEFITTLIKDALKNFKKDDYVLVSGPAWLSMIAALVLFKTHKEVKFLIFDAKLREYIVRHLNSADF
jgi:hypothetical protein